ncbi:DUF2238 domain-containing protein [Mycoplasmatota bacterium WC44]
MSKSNNQYYKKEKKKHILLLVLSFFILVWSAIFPLDKFAWVMLTLPAVIYVLCLVFTYKKFQFTTLAYIMVFVHIAILLTGAKYTYNQNPLFLVLKEIFNSSRNHFDRVGHLAQGFAPVFLVKEFLLRKGYLKRSKFFYVIVFSFILAISASWELLEFLATIISNKPASYVLSNQGDIWDTQWDMVMALIGALSSLLIFGKLHDKKIEEIESRKI